MIAATVDWKVLSVAAVLLLIAMILLYRMMSRDPNVRRSRYGFFVERDRYEEEPPWPELQPPLERTLPQWPDREETVETDTEAKKKAPPP